MIGHISVFRIKLIQKRLELPVNQTFGSYEVDYSCNAAHNMLHLPEFDACVVEDCWNCGSDERNGMETMAVAERQMGKMEVAELKMVR